MKEYGIPTLTLDEIVQELANQKDGRRDGGESEIIIVEKDTGELVDEVPFFTFKKYRYFEISRSAIAFNVYGPELRINYSNSPYPFKLQIIYDAKLHDKGLFNLIRTLINAETAIDGVNKKIKETIAAFIFDKKDIVSEYKKYEKQLEELVSESCLKCGLVVTPSIKVNIENKSSGDVEQFVSCDHKVSAKTKDAQDIEINHYLALTLSDPIKLELSGEYDVRSWAKRKLDQFTNNSIIERTYAEVLVDMDESIIKRPMQEACQKIGYELKQLVTVPGLDIEKFYFETADDADSTDYATKDTRLKISMNIIVNGRLDLHDEKTKEYIKPGFDIIAGMKKHVISHLKLFINDITPDECFTQQYTIEEKLEKLIRSKLKSSYGFKELGITIKFLENNLSKRLSLLMEKPKKVDLLADWAERKYGLWVRILGVSKDGWYRFRANNYITTEDELNDIGRMVKNGMESSILRIGDEITGKLINNEFNNVRQRVEQEFGLSIGIHDFNEEFSDEEELHIKSRKAELDEKYIQQQMIQQAETGELNEYLKLKETAVKAEENEDVIKKLDEKIASFQKKNNKGKSKFLEQKTDNNFLLPPHSSRNSDPNTLQEPT